GELLADAVRPLVLPVVEGEGFIRRGVLEVELAARETLRARERAAREEGCDEGGGVADAGDIAGRVRFERATGNAARQIAAELAVHRGVDEMAVLAGRVAGTGALARERDERS